MRCAVATLGPGRFALLLQVHHIVIDGWSAGIMVRELARGYNASADGEPAPLDPLPISRTRTTRPGRPRCSPQALDDSRRYRRRVFADPVEPLEMPRDRARPSLQTFGGDDVPVTIHRDLTASLRALAQRSGVSLFVLLTAIVKTLLHRYTGQDDIVIGTPVAARSHPDLEPQVGFYTNTLALRDRVTRAGRHWPHAHAAST